MAVTLRTPRTCALRALLPRAEDSSSTRSGWRETGAAMIAWLSDLIGAVAAIWLISSGLVYMVSPQQGGEMLKRLAIFLAGALVGICLLRQFAACIGPLSLLLLAPVIIIAAYFIWEARRG